MPPLSNSIHDTKLIFGSLNQSLNGAHHVKCQPLGDIAILRPYIKSAVVKVSQCLQDHHMYTSRVCYSGLPRFSQWGWLHIIFFKQRLTHLTNLSQNNPPPRTLSMINCYSNVDWSGSTALILLLHLLGKSSHCLIQLWSALFSVHRNDEIPIKTLWWTILLLALSAVLLWRHK